MRKLLSLSLILALFAGVGCDSNEDDDPSDRELLIGNHTAVKIEDSEGDHTATFQQLIEEFAVSIDSDGTYELTVDYKPIAEQAGRNDLLLSGGYSVNESAKTLTIQARIGEGSSTSVPLTFRYEFLGNDRTKFTTAGAADLVILNGALGANYEGNLIVTVEKQ